MASEIDGETVRHFSREDAESCAGIHARHDLYPVLTRAKRHRECDAIFVVRIGVVLGEVEIVHRSPTREW